MAEDEEKDPNAAAGTEGSYSKAELYIERYKKLILSVLVLIILSVGGYFGYKRLYLKPLDREASAEMWKAEYYFGVDSLDNAIRGDRTGYMGFEGLVERYGGTRSGELARYYLAVAYLRTETYSEAAEEASSVSTENEILAALSQGVAGDAHVEMGELEKAVERFKSAASRSDNGLTRPLYLKKAGLALEELGRYEKALALYERIRDEHPASEEGQDIEKYIGRADSYL